MVEWIIELIVVRHGETDWNRIRRLQGHTDIALNATGIDQADRLRDALAGEEIDAIYASDLSRAMETARPIADLLRLPIRSDRLLRERNYGVLEGLTFPEIVEQHPDEAEHLRLRSAEHTIPGGESQRTFFDRVVDTVSRIAKVERDMAAARGSSVSTILIVTHGGVLDMLHRSASGLALDAERACPIPNAAINRLRFDKDRFVVRSWAEEP